MKTLVLLSFVVFLASCSDAIGEEDTGFRMLGSVNVASGLKPVPYGTASSHAMYLNFGGPSLGATFLHFRIEVSCYPALKYIYAAPDNYNSVTVALGVGPSVSYRHAVLSLPFFFPTNSATDVAVGLGYRFGAD